MEVLIILKKNNSKLSERKSKKACAASRLDNKRTKCMPRKLFICGFEDHLIAKSPKTTKGNYKQ